MHNMKIKIKTYNGELPSYLTVGKVYEVWGDDGWYSQIFDDENDMCQISMDNCDRLNGGEWEVVSE